MCITAVCTENTNSFLLLFNSFLSFHNVPGANQAPQLFSICAHCRSCQPSYCLGPGAYGREPDRLNSAIQQFFLRQPSLASYYSKGITLSPALTQTIKQSHGLSWPKRNFAWKRQYVRIPYNSIFSADEMELLKSGTTINERIWWGTCVTKFVGMI